MDQVVQIIGAILILAGFILAQTGRTDTQSFLYLVLNLVGSTILAILGYIEAQWGFMLLETVWAIVSLVSLWKRWAARDSVSASP